MIFISKNKGSLFAEKTAQIVAQEADIFRALGLAALKARASMLKPGAVIKIGGYELVVDEDELGQWVTVQIIHPRVGIEALGDGKAKDLGINLDAMSYLDRQEWLRKFMQSLNDLLWKWQDIRCIPGPGDNLTLEKKAYRKDRDWR